MVPTLNDAVFRLSQILMLTAVLVFASGTEGKCREPITPDHQLRRTLSVTGVGVITAWGIANWDYFSRSPKAASEGWFGQDTPEGGADKLGHLFTTYATAQGISSLFEYWCFSPQDAASYGALSSLAILGYMEVGDVFTDYNNSKYLVALKLNGFDTFRHSVFRLIELHAGYYARGYPDPDEPDERTLYVGIGLNLTDLFRRHGHNKTATFLNYYQPPGIYLPAEKRLDD